MKCVLITYLDRNKVVKLPESSECDVEALKKEFVWQFNFDNSASHTISFHRYDDDWQEYIELDVGCTVNDKEKLKVIVTPKPREQRRTFEVGS